jgi:putative endonuclease
MYLVYAIYNADNNKFYIGQTKDLSSRLMLHNSHTFKHCYTTKFAGKWDLVYKEEMYTRQEALKREKQLKSYQGRQFIKSIIENSRVAQR